MVTICIICSAVPNCSSLDIITIKGILLMAFKSITSVTFPCFSIISQGTCSLAVHTCSVGRLVVLPLSDAKLVQNKSLLQNVLSCEVTVWYHIAFDVF